MTSGPTCSAREQRNAASAFDCSAWDAAESGLSAMCVDGCVRDWLRHSPGSCVSPRCCRHKAYAGTTKCSSCRFFIADGVQLLVRALEVQLGCRLRAVPEDPGRGDQGGCLHPANSIAGLHHSHMLAISLISYVRQQFVEVFLQQV